MKTATISKLDVLRWAHLGVINQLHEADSDELAEELEALANHLERRITSCMQGLARHNKLILCTRTPMTAGYEQ